MIGIGTIGRAAESGGSTNTYQNGQYIVVFVWLPGSNYNSEARIYYSTDFGATFSSRLAPLQNVSTNKMHINYLGEIMLVYDTSLYYAASPTSDWVLIENNHKDTLCVVSWDFNTIMYSNEYTYSVSTNKGMSFTTKDTTSITGVPFNLFRMTYPVMSGDGSKVFIRNFNGRKFTNSIVFDSITGAYIANSISPDIICNNSDYYGNYFTGQILSSSCIKHITTYTPFNLNINGAYLAPSDNGWVSAYTGGDMLIRFYSLPSYSHYKSVMATFNIKYIPDSREVISGNYLYFYDAPSGATYVDIYKIDSIVGHIYEFVNRINIGVSNYSIAAQAVSKVPLTLL